MEGEPNDWQRHQRCLTYLKDQVEIYKCSDRSSVEGKIGKYNREPDRHDHRSTWSWGSCTFPLNTKLFPRISSGTAPTTGTTGTAPRPPGTSARRPPSPQTPPSYASIRPSSPPLDHPPPPLDRPPPPLDRPSPPLDRPPPTLDRPPPTLDRPPPPLDVLYIQ